MSIRTTLAAVAASVAVAGSALVVAGGPAAAEGPVFSSPPTAASGTPVHVRSVDVCPSPFHPDNYRFVAVQIAAQASPNSSGVKEVLADVRPDGSWDLVIDAPDGVAAGSRASYFLEAECWEVDLSSPNTPGSAAPASAPPNAYCAAAGGDPQKQHRLCYQPRKLAVTGEVGEAPTGGSDGDTAPSTGNTGTTGGTTGGTTATTTGSTSPTLPETLDLRTGAPPFVVAGTSSSSVSDDEAAARVRAYLEAQRELRRLMDEQRAADVPEVAFAPVAATGPAASGGSGLGALPLAFMFVLGGFTAFAAARRTVARR